MKIEIERFADGRLKMVNSYSEQSDANVRIKGDEGKRDVSIVPKNTETKLVNEVLELINFGNLMLQHPRLKEAIHKLVREYLDWFKKNGHGYIQ